MRVLNRLTALFACVLFGLGSVPAVGQQGLMITLTNDTTDGISVTAYDRNSNQMVLSGRQIYGSASLTVSISADSTGQGHLSWTAVTIDRDMHQCGHGDKAHLNDGDNVNVHANGDCNAG